MPWKYADNFFFSKILWQELLYPEKKEQSEQKSSQVTPLALDVETVVDAEVADDAEVAAAAAAEQENSNALHLQLSLSRVRSSFSSSSSSDSNQDGQLPYTQE